MAREPQYLSPNLARALLRFVNSLCSKDSERENEREGLFVWCARERGRERGREGVSVCVCVRERERESKR